MGHAYHGQQGQLLPLDRSRLVRVAGVALALALVAGDTTSAQRDRIRLRPRGSTRVSQAQASELTLTLTDVAVRPVQVWVRTAGPIAADRRTITASLPAEEAARVRTGQRVRAFSPQSRSRMHQGTVTRVGAAAAGGVVQVSLAGEPLDDSRYYVLEIVTEPGDFLSIPNEAILESAGTQVAYVQAPDGSYVPRPITVGVRGELFTQVVAGLTPGEQVVTIGSFFIDAEHRLK